jgi:hypothetical protein
MATWILNNAEIYNSEDMDLGRDGFQSRIDYHFSVGDVGVPQLDFAKSLQLNSPGNLSGRGIYKAGGPSSGWNVSLNDLSGNIISQQNGGVPLGSGILSVYSDQSAIENVASFSGSPVFGSYSGSPVNGVPVFAPEPTSGLAMMVTLGAAALFGGRRR